MSDRHYTAERAELAKVYPGKKWVDKVMNMSDAQVHETLVSIRKRKEEGRNGSLQGRASC